MDNRGQMKLSDLVPVILVIVFAIIIAAVGGLILSDVQDTNTGGSTRLTVDNETFSVFLFDNTSIDTNNRINPRGSGVGQAGSIVDGTLIITNATTGETVFDNTTTPNIGAGNFSSIDLTQATVNLTSAAPEISNASLHIVNTSSNFNVSFAFDVPVFTGSENISESGGSALTNTTAQLPLLGTVIGLVLIIGVVVGLFAFRRRGSGANL